MKKWILLVNKERFDFSNFHDAATMLKAEISKHMEINEDVFGREGDPFSPGAFFSGRYLDGTITDEDIVVSTRLNMLCRSFIWRGIDFAKDNARKSVLNSIHYMSKNDEFGEQLNIDIDVKKDEIVLDVTHYDSDGKETYMRSNAFILDDLHKKYYFKSHQIVTTTSQKDDLGKVVDLNILLKEEE